MLGMVRINLVLALQCIQCKCRYNVGTAYLRVNIKFQLIYVPDVIISDSFVSSQLFRDFRREGEDF